MQICKKLLLLKNMYATIFNFIRNLIYHKFLFRNISFRTFILLQHFLY